MNSSEQQLLDDIKESFPGFKCSLQDLRNPTEEFVTNFYSFFLQEFAVDITNVSQTQFSQTAVTGLYHDAFSGIIPKMNLLSAIRAFNIVADFGMLDIVSPKPKRIQNILRTFISFYRWSDERMASLMMEKNKLNERQKILYGILKKKEEMTDTLNHILKNIAEIQNTKAQLEEKDKHLRKYQSELKMEKEVLKAQTEEADKILKEKENALQKINKEESLITNKIRDCSNMIVDSPSSILIDIEGVRKKCEEVKGLSELKRDMVESKMQAHDQLNTALNHQLQRAEHLEELLKQIDQRRELLQVVTNIEKSTSALQEELQGLKSMLLALSNRGQNRQEQLQSLNMRWKTLKPQLIESVESANRELVERKSEKNKMIDSLKEDADVQKKIDTLLKNIKEYVEMFKNDLAAILATENDRNALMYSKMEALMKNLRKEVAMKYKLEKKRE